MSFKDSRFGRLVINVGLAFVAGAVTAFAALVSTTPKDDPVAFAIAVGAGLLFAGVRAVIGYLLLVIPKVPAVPTDTA